LVTLTELRGWLMSAGDEWAGHDPDLGGLKVARESQTLTELRDWLLPMLTSSPCGMNGQVKVQG